MTFFDKTTRGRAEISVRGNNLTPRLRTLLLLVDGKTSTADLLFKVSGMGLSHTHLDTLVEAGLIQGHVTATAPSNDTLHPHPPVPAEALPSPPNSPVPAAPPIQAAPPPPPPASLAIGQSQYEQVYRFYNETIKSMIGIRGYGLQMKVERAATVDDFKEIRQQYLEAILKSKGKETTRSLRDRLDHLLYQGLPGPNSINLD
ncbi:hypothetical protein [Glaciimonas sp. PAMC28666]|uniref:hypothetical protein n=1 Tax=Glaciimonas sp. PAMC28666 TaxID=2807626 RepID=UPI0019655C2D|nr:hypothetical protein [Glaciimonas sp. PAMC28666]QRX82688.1 hypothetical protein JQN73_21975 [Glaciimonas sp. PAMC28666]